jgi:hypothetical protein
MRNILLKYLLPKIIILAGSVWTNTHAVYLTKKKKKKKKP